MSKISVLYLSDTTSKKEFNILYGNTNKFDAYQVFKFTDLFVKGLNNNNAKVSVISSRYINNEIASARWFKAKKDSDGKIEYNYLPFFNYKGFRQIGIYLHAKKEIKRWIKNNPDGYIFIDVLNCSLLMALSKIKTKKVKAIGVVTDIPGLNAHKENTPRSQKIIKLTSELDGMVLLAEPMKNIINPNQKPFVVIEGFCDKNMQLSGNNLNNKYDRKVVMYAGFIHKKYGIKNLTEAFIKANICESELHIYGLGDYEDELKEICSKHNNIRYFGSVNNDIIVEEELKATLLVNPRPTNENFVKYSFPSKNMEYMASGTPMLTTNLPSMPEEYKEHCFVLEDESVDGMANKLIEILSIDKADLHKKGLEAKEWVLKNKNNIVQTKKIIDFIERI